MDRNWNEILQELRVMQTGIQLMVGFLLTLPFTTRFSELSDQQVATYLVLIVIAVATTALIVAPTALHRSVFQQNYKGALVRTAHHCALVGLVLFALLSGGVLYFVFDVVLGRAEALTAGLTGLCFFVVLWGSLMRAVRSARHGPRRTRASDVSGNDERGNA